MAAQQIEQIDQLFRLQHAAHSRKGSSKPKPRSVPRPGTQTDRRAPASPAELVAFLGGGDA